MAKKINPFRFKQFVVHHDRCAMKVGTDAVLLGAWVNINNVNSALDIGSGSGVIALMLGQRTKADARIDAVEIDPNSFLESNDNVANSPWPKKIRTHLTSIQEYVTEQKYDLIVSNPPYFINSLLPPVPNRSDARHTSTLSHIELLIAAKRLMRSTGKFGVILPTLEGDQFQNEAIQFGLYCLRKTAFHARSSKPQERWLLEFGFEPAPVVSDTLVLYVDGEHWTESYRNLTQEFYL